MANYYRDNKEFTTRELVDTYYKGVSLPQGYDFTKDGAKIIFPTPKPTTTQLQQAVRNGVELDANGNTVQAWIVQDMFSDYINEDGILVTKLEQEEAYIQAEFKKTVPDVITMRQARLALLGAGLLSTVDNTIASGLDEAMKIEWEYAQEVRRDWESLNTMATALGMSELELDNLFIAGNDL